MKKITFVALAALGVLGSSGAYAAAAADTTVCNGATYAPSFDVPTGTAGQNFIMNAFKAKCSKNVELHYTDLTNGVGVGVGSASVKGKNAISANSNGGSMTQTACAIAGGCTAAEVTTATGAAVTAAGSS